LSGLCRHFLKPNDTYLSKPQGQAFLCLVALVCPFTLQRLRLATRTVAKQLGSASDLANERRQLARLLGQMSLLSPNVTFTFDLRLRRGHEMRVLTARDFLWINADNCTATVFVAGQAACR